MAALIESSSKKVCNVVSVFDSPDCSQEDRHIVFVGNDKIVVNENFAVELVGVFDGHGGVEASEFLREYAREILAYKMCATNESSSLYNDVIRLEKPEVTRENITRKLSNKTLQGEIDRQVFIESYIESLNIQLCAYLSACNVLSRDPGSTLSMNINFVTKKEHI